MYLIGIEVCLQTMECPICFESRSFNEFKYPACKHPLCHECVAGLHSSMSGALHPRCPACRQELQDPTELLERQLMDARRSHERERLRWEAERAALHQDLKRALLTQVHLTSALKLQNQGLRAEVGMQVEADSAVERIGSHWTYTAQSMLYSLTQKYEKKEWKYMCETGPYLFAAQATAGTSSSGSGIASSSVSAGARLVPVRVVEQRREQRRQDGHPYSSISDTPWVVKLRARMRTGVE